MINQNLVQKINKLTRNSPIFYVTNDAERALGLEKILNNFHIVCIDHNDMVDYMLNDGVKVFCLEKELGEKNVIFRNSAKLLKHELTQKYIKESSHSGGFLITFKISTAFEKEAEKLGLKVLNTKANLNRKFENKISQYESMSPNGIKFPKTIVGELGAIEYSSLLKEIGEEIVIQFDRGHTGSGTFFVRSKGEFSRIVSDFPKRLVRISSKIEGKVFTLNCIATSKATLCAGLSYQITGVEGLTGQEGGTVGNDFYYISKLSEQLKTRIINEAEKIGSKMKKDGYLGFFGIDLIVRGNEIFVIEINARQPASVSFFNKLQILNDQTPASLYHLAELMGVDYDVEAKMYNTENTQVVKASQIFLRNTENKIFTVCGSVKTGFYRLQSDNSATNWDSETVKDNTIFIDEDKDKPLVYNGEGYSVEQSEGGFVLLTQSKGKYINSGNELARIQLMQKAVDEKGNLLQWIRESLIAVNNYLR
ncbi:ATP-grasp domain-containing protein [Candidatus Dojkabacteria bacterium]|nr:ATP-grasp domain-containing protein [Candidatus Dojkabacteria bacterium]